MVTWLMVSSCLWCHHVEWHHLVPPQAGHSVVEQQQHQRTAVVKPAELRVHLKPPGDSTVHRDHRDQAEHTAEKSINQSSLQGATQSIEITTCLTYKKGSYSKSIKYTLVYDVISSPPKVHLQYQWSVINTTVTAAETDWDTVREPAEGSITTLITALRSVYSSQTVTEVHSNMLWKESWV